MVNSDMKITREMAQIVENKFTIDASVSKVKDENIDFAHYLLERELSINIYDADSMLQYGMCRVPLSEMMRQGRATVVKAKDCDIASFDASDRSITGAVKMGSLQILICNLGKHEAVKDVEYDEALPDTMFEKDERPQTGEGARSQPSQKYHKYKKKVKSKPIDLLQEEMADSSRRPMATTMPLGFAEEQT